ncbi:hypothetical protein [Mesorhizobium mediterraneum]|uniref:hypothetical protein n=1 Tax=Mesorhizobium mediterraneum TaxID=43617 RepID=UPI00177F597C|nr:hypothetical protein [Mesorhizobium mediterraneum]
MMPRVKKSSWKQPREIQEGETLYGSGEVEAILDRHLPGRSRKATITIRNIIFDVATGLNFELLYRPIPTNAQMSSALSDVSEKLDEAIGALHDLDDGSLDLLHRTAKDWPDENDIFLTSEYEARPLARGLIASDRMRHAIEVATALSDWLRNAKPDTAHSPPGKPKHDAERTAIGHLMRVWEEWGPKGPPSGKFETFANDVLTPVLSKHPRAAQSLKTAIRDATPAGL